MAARKITVLKKRFHEDLAEEYCLKETGACSLFRVGRDYIADFPMKQPEGFPCSGAWAGIANFVLVLMQGGSFGPSSSWEWMKDDKTMSTCCSDGVRPVISKLELP